MVPYFTQQYGNPHEHIPMIPKKLSLRLMLFDSVAKGKDVARFYKSSKKHIITTQIMNVDLMSISGHNIYGPKGMDVLYVHRKQRVRLEAIQKWKTRKRIEKWNSTYTIDCWYR
ncbi:10754_t:CDS:2 [Diversispora eburnea]|uniref:10754_t:CDS:1 n=1 Tax=Diversispora eburnea TaxID=1213867 RepID=A0A9N9C1T7_9GLOM|nr:10754_t:CDS:2 [Diversispora eburnea]